MTNLTTSIRANKYLKKIIQINKAPTYYSHPSYSIIEKFKIHIVNGRWEEARIEHPPDRIFLLDICIEAGRAYYWVNRHLIPKDILELLSLEIPERILDVSSNFVRSINQLTGGKAKEDISCKFLRIYYNYTIPDKDAIQNARDLYELGLPLTRFPLCVQQLITDPKSLLRGVVDDLSQGTRKYTSPYKLSSLT